MFEKARVIAYGKPDITGFEWCKEGLAFKIVNGLGKLKHVSGVSDKEGYYFRQLKLNDFPLVQGHFPVCPTCYGMLATGYGIEKVKSDELAAIRETLNQNYSGMAAAFSMLIPLLKLLSDGLYMLADVELIPTDGHNFFYNVPNEMTENSALCDQFYNSDFLTVTEGFPAFMYPTQSSSSINDACVDDYRNRLKRGDEIRGLAYYEKGFVCALLDGHHKAIAAAQLGKKLKCLTIIPLDGCRLEESKLPYRKRKVETFFFAGIPINSKSACTYEDVFPGASPQPQMHVGQYELTDKRFASMEKAVFKLYHSVEQISHLDAAGIDDATVTDADINRWISLADDDGGIRLKYLLEYRGLSDYESAYHIAETIINSGSRNMPYREAWKILLQKKDNHTENMAIQYLVAHSPQDEYWDLVTSYWDK